MSIFGRDKQQDERLDEIERQLRRLTEQVGGLSVALGETRRSLLNTQAVLDDADPAWAELDELLKRSRQQVDQTSAAADEAWAELQARTDGALADLQTRLDRATGES